MKKLLPLFVLGTAGLANAQTPVVIDQADFITAGETVTFGNDEDVSDLNLNVSTVGSNQTFDFSSLQTDNLTEVGFFEPEDVTGGTDFPDADVAVEQFGGVYGFTTIDAGSVSIIGLGGNFAGQLGIPGSFELSLEASDPWTIFEFPASLSSPTLLDTAAFEGRFPAAGLLPAGVEFVWPNIDSVWVKRSTYFESDVVADGVLTDALGETHNVLMLKVIENNLDSLWGRDSVSGLWVDPPSTALSLAGIELPSNDTVFRTRYISKELGYYVVDITTEQDGTPISASFVSNADQCCTSVEEVVARGENVIYPNPTNDFVRVRTGGEIYQFNVMDMSGKLLQTTRVTFDGEAVDLNNLSNGLYIYQMLNEQGKISHTGRLSVIK